MTDPANKVMDKMERGQRPTDEELAEAGYCLGCAGFGSNYIDEGDDAVEIICKKCGGTGEAADVK